MTSVGGALLLATPEVVVVLLLLRFALQTGALPVGGMASVTVAGGIGARLSDRLAHMALPVLALMLPSVPWVLRHVRSAMAETLVAPFVRAARGHGIPRRRLLWRHVLPAAANPIVTVFGGSLGALLGGSLLVEVVMGWPGMGPLMLEAILGRDVHVMVGSVTLTAAVLAGGNLVADILLYMVDPRVRGGP